MRGANRIRHLICDSGRWRHVIISRSIGLGLLALAVACDGGLVLARYELSRDQVLRRAHGRCSRLPIESWPSDNRGASTDGVGFIVRRDEANIPTCFHEQPPISLYGQNRAARDEVGNVGEDFFEDQWGPLH
jgi:hypothetical protein